MWPMCLLFCINRMQEGNGIILPLRVTYDNILLSIYNMHCNSAFNVFFIVIYWPGPKPKTISDFWTMIWQEEVCNIVCLTNLKEGTKVQI